MLWQCWTVRLGWQSGRSSYERSRCTAWPIGTSAVQVILDTASDPDNGCDVAKCHRVEAHHVGEPYEAPDPVAPPKGEP